MSTDNLCFGAKIRKIGKSLHTSVFKKLGFKGVFIAWTCWLPCFLSFRVLFVVVILFQSV